MDKLQFTFDLPTRVTGDSPDAFLIFGDVEPSENMTFEWSDNENSHDWALQFSSFGKNDSLLYPGQPFAVLGTATQNTIIPDGMQIKGLFEVGLNSL